MIGISPVMQHQRLCATDIMIGEGRYSHSISHKHQIQSWWMLHAGFFWTSQKAKQPMEDFLLIDDHFGTAGALPFMDNMPIISRPNQIWEHSYPWKSIGRCFLYAPYLIGHACVYWSISCFHGLVYNPKTITTTATRTAATTTKKNNICVRYLVERFWIRLHSWLVAVITAASQYS